jgi:hypothetical protein
VCISWQQQFLSAMNEHRGQQHTYIHAYIFPYLLQIRQKGLHSVILPLNTAPTPCCALT